MGEVIIRVSYNSEEDPSEINRMQSLSGVIYGKTIQLREDPGFQPGQAISVDLKAAALPDAYVWGEGIQRSAGALVDMPELDVLMEDIQAARKSDFGRQPLESQE